MLKNLQILLLLLSIIACFTMLPTHSYAVCGKCKDDFRETDYFLVILVNARHLDYSCAKSLFRSIAKHPSDGSKNGDVGHAWIYLRGKLDGQPVYIEGGHSGELGICQARYFEGVMNYIDYGYANPTPREMTYPRYEPNPVKYLWAVQHDGFFQFGSSYHRPTFAAKVDITKDQFEAILEFINPECYPYKEYALTGNQCSSFVAGVAAIAGLRLDCEATVEIDQYVTLCGERLKLWEDSRYSAITFSSPDIVEHSLKKAVCEGRAEEALGWYLQSHPKRLGTALNELWDSILNFPVRMRRVSMFR